MAKWETKEGVKMDVSKMTETHLRNTLLMLIRKLPAPVLRYMLNNLLDLKNKQEVTASDSISRRFKEEEIREIENDFEEDTFY
jgi:hypothetical protein